MELRQLKIFLMVASRLNITRAAEELHLSQSSVSEQIQNLEGDLKSKLFDRSSRQLRLTAAGQRLLDYATPLLALADEARSSVQIAAGVAFGNLAIGALETICAMRLPPIIAAYTAAHPSISVDVSAANTRELLKQVNGDTLDVCFVFGERQSEKNLHCEILNREELVVLIPSNHPLSIHDEVTLEDLRAETFLVTKDGCVYRDMFENAFSTLETRPRIASEIDSIATLTRLVEMGMGCALLPRMLVNLSDVRYVAVTCRGFTSTDVPISMLWRRRDVQPPQLTLFLESVRGCFAGIKPADDRHRHEALSP